MCCVPTAASSRATSTSRSNAPPASGSRVGVFFLDLDNFKTINDSMGHAYGDLVLQAIAQRLRYAIPHDAFAARLGGDEFTVIVEAPTAARAARNRARRSRSPSRSRTSSRIASSWSGVSLGASLFPDHEDEAAALLLRAADAALFSAKSAGRSRLAVFEPALLEAASLKFRIEQGLRRAVERGEFELLFQPEVSLGRLGHVPRRGAPALAPAGWAVRVAGRVPHRGGGVGADHDDQRLGDAGGDRAGRGLASRRVAGRARRDQLCRRASCSMRASTSASAQLLEQYRLPPACIEIELTETVLQTGEATIAMLKRLRALGNLHCAGRFRHRLLHARVDRAVCR